LSSCNQTRAYRLQPIPKSLCGETVVVVIRLNRIAVLFVNAKRVIQFEASLDFGHGLTHVWQRGAPLKIVKWLQLLYRIALDTGSNAVPDDCKKVDKNTGAKKVINFVLSGGIAPHQAFQRGRFVRRVMKNVKVGVLLKTCHNEVNESLESS